MEQQAEKVIGNLIWQDPERMGGEPCFYGTRVPVQNLWDYLEGGDSIDDFIEGFNLPPSQVRSVLELARQGLLRELEAV